MKKKPNYTKLLEARHQVGHGSSTLNQPIWAVGSTDVVDVAVVNKVPPKTFRDLPMVMMPIDIKKHVVVVAGVTVDHAIAATVTIQPQTMTPSKNVSHCHWRKTFTGILNELFR